jgi:hypothetical protein
MTQDVVQYILGPRQHIVVPIAKHTISMLLQDLRADFVCIGLLDMLSTIQLDHQLDLRANEIRDVASDRDLPSELEFRQLVQSQMPPKMPFGIGRLITQFTRQ